MASAGGQFTIILPTHDLVLFDSDIIKELLSV